MPVQFTASSNCNVQFTVHYRNTLELCIVQNEVTRWVKFHYTSVYHTSVYFTSVCCTPFALLWKLQPCCCCFLLEREGLGWGFHSMLVIPVNIYEETHTHIYAVLNVRYYECIPGNDLYALLSSRHMLNQELKSWSTEWVQPSMLGWSTQNPLINIQLKVDKPWE